ncbi:MAG TPA: hypothetical protein VKT82_14625 [Ktedonobacterales bacterium]|nr:hypothetical protein [Ktedonobacterales bacterium]
MLISAALSQTPLLNLVLSLVFGVGQVVVGAAMIIFTLRRARWRRLSFFGLALIGAWLAASGITELVVSGTELLARLSSTISATSAQQIRARADTAFLDVSLALLAVGAAYLLLARRWITPHSKDQGSVGQASDHNTTTSSISDDSEADVGQEAIVPSSEPEG